MLAKDEDLELKIKINQLNEANISAEEKAAMDEA